jgi:hypothetical protein
MSCLACEASDHLAYGTLLLTLVDLIGAHLDKGFYRLFSFAHLAAHVMLFPVVIFNGAHLDMWVFYRLFSLAHLAAHVMLFPEVILMVLI